MIKIRRTNSSFEIEPFMSPFGFKGGYVHGASQAVAMLESESGHRGIGIGTLSPLWSDARVFSENSEAAGNSLMFLVMEEALRASRNIPFETPFDLLEQLIPIAYDYGKSITKNRDLRLTFALNALVAVDNAAWKLYCAETGIRSFDEMVPESIRPALSHRHKKLACIPLMSYGVPLNEIVKTVDDGYFFLKIKIGSDPDNDGDLEKMLQWDKERLSAIHAAVKDREIPYTDDGRIP